MTRSLPLAFVASFLVGVSAADEPRPAPEQVQFFETKIRPVLVERCQKCHGPEKQQGGLRLDSAESLRKGGDSGPVVVPGEPEESLLLRAVRHEGPKMPPKEKLPAEVIAHLAAWIRQGAPWPQVRGTSAIDEVGGQAARSHWAFQPVREPTVPAVKDRAWPRTSIDRFVLARLEERGLQPVEPADRRTLLRRVTFDLTGLPPTPEEIADALRDPSPAWFARVVDRLLASPAYGERWGRHWLDLVRYADTAGDNSDYPVPDLYKYRNWVIRAFNQDMPYDQFLCEQLAGDLLPGDNEQEKYDKLIATGYLANTRRFGSYEDARYQWYLTYEDTIDNLGRTVLGLTINCARCHDHKFDPISMEDYYGLYGFFQSTRYPWPGIELDKAPRDLVPLVPLEQAEPVLRQRREKLGRLEAEVKRLNQELEQANKALKSLKAGSPEHEAAQKQVADLTKSLEAARKVVEKQAQEPLPFPTAYAVIDKERGQNARIQLRGDPEKPGKEVPRKFLAILGGQTVPQDQRGSGRLELARWLTDPANPLTARVMVNRIWHYHFGQGLVQTPSDFGKQGKPPTHPELLDYLARRFIESGWSVKALHRLILLSATYQLSSRDDAANAQVDPGNELLWRFSRRRLDAEAIRDTLLTLGGNLDRSPGGPHPFPHPTTWSFTQHNPFKAVYETNRRSVYLMTQRIQRHPYLALFDGPDPNASTAKRITSTTPLQALYLMNDPFVQEQSRRFAARLLAQQPDDAGRRELAFLLAFGRTPTAEEHALGEQYLASATAKLGGTVAAWESFSRAVLLSNELVYVH